MRNGLKAIQTATKACLLTKWQNARYIDTLAAAYAEQGDFQKAIKFQKMALSFDGLDQEVIQGMRQRLADYQDLRPYRDSVK